MTSNTDGVYPIDPTTDVGLFRFNSGDVVGTPTTAGRADYEFISDAYISALLAQYPDTPNIALAVALGSMATQLIAAAQDIQVDDIKIKTVEKANAMLARSQSIYTAALAGDASSLFQVVPSTIGSDAGFPPQGTPYAFPYGHLPGTPYPIGPSGF